LACATCAASAPMRYSRGWDDLAAWVGGVERRTRTAAKREFEFQLEPCGIGPGEHIPATGRKAGVGFLFTAGRIHSRLPPDDQHVQGGVEQKQQPDNKFLYQRRERCCRTGGRRTAQ